MNFLEMQLEVLSNIADQSLTVEVKTWINRVRKELCKDRQFKWMLKTRTFPAVAGTSSYTFDNNLSTDRYSGVYGTIRYAPHPADSVRKLCPLIEYDFDERFPATLVRAPYFFKVIGNTFYLEGVEGTLTDIDTPVNAVFTATTGTLNNATYYYRVSATLGGGESLASTETSLPVSAGPGANGVVVNWTKVAGATGYKVYGRTTGAGLLIATVGDVSTYTDTGAITPAGALPTAASPREHFIAGYYALPNDLSNPGDEEYIDKKHDDAIIAGATLKGFIHLRDKNGIQLWNSLYERLAKVMINQDRTGEITHFPMNTFN